MSFEPEPGFFLELGSEKIEFLSLESTGPASVFVYAESGKEGIVYKVLKGKEYYALKVFYPQYRDIRLLENTEKISRFKKFEGFRVAERTVIEHSSFPKVLDRYPELNYAVLMPWIEGTVWANLMLENGESLQQEGYLRIGQALTRVVANLEAQGLAHCDLSNNNFIIAKDSTTIQLVDVEDMYAPDMPRPVPDVSYGTIGYRTRWIAENGLWGPESDRFAFAILCSEILTWHNTEIRENKAENTSFFIEDEIGEVIDRYRMMKKHLGELSGDLANFFEAAWFAQNSSQCPPISDWKAAIENLVGPTLPIVEKVDYAQPIVEDKTPAIEIIPDEIPPREDNPLEEKTWEMKKYLDVSTGIPPRMEISNEIIDLGVLDQRKIKAKFQIANTGGSLLTGTIQPESWLLVNPVEFSIQPGEKQIFGIGMNETYPKPRNGLEYRTANAIIIESNNGTQIIGIKYQLKKQPFYKSGWMHFLTGGVVGFILLFACLCLLMVALAYYGS